MTKIARISEIRRENLRLIIDKKYEGVDRQLALKLGVQQTQLSRYFSESKSKRNISDQFARNLEAQESLPDGWMDVIHVTWGDFKSNIELFIPEWLLDSLDSASKKSGVNVNGEILLRLQKSFDYPPVIDEIASAIKALERTGDTIDDINESVMELLDPVLELADNIVERRGLIIRSIIKLEIDPERKTKSA